MKMTVTINRLGRPKKAVAYVRVSTGRQADEGLGLEHQERSIFGFAQENGYVVVSICDDVTSGKDRGAMTLRPGLAAAVNEAKRVHGTIIVARMDRISRDRKKFLDFCRSEKVRVVSVVPSERDSFASQYQAVGRGEKVHRNIVVGTNTGIQSAKAKGSALGNPISLSIAGSASGKARSNASQMKVLDIRDFLLRHPEYRDRSAAETARLLNAAGILSGWDRPWTKDSVRRQLHRAREELKLLEEPDEVC